MNPINWLIGVLRGTVLSPVHTAFARGVLEAAAFLILYAVADYVLTLPDVNALVLLLIPTVVRTLEGLVDKIDHAKQRQRAALRSSAEDAEWDPTITPLEQGDVIG